MVRLNQAQIQKLKKRSAPINYRSLSVSKSGKLIQDKEETFEELLDKRIVSGYALTWAATNDYGERFIKGAFSKSIKDNGPDSNSTYQIKFRDRHGKSVSLFAKLEEDEIGLYFRTVPLDNVQWADDLLVQLRSGTINNFSIGFRYIWDKVEWDDENDTMVVLEASLFEISAVDIPSDTTSYALRTSEEVETIDDDIEKFISSLRRSQQLQARKLFSSQKALLLDEPLEQRRKALKERSRKKKNSSIDYNYIKNNLKF